MIIFLGTLIIVGLCCLAMGLGLLIADRPLSGGCGKKPAGSQGCEGCPGRRRADCAKTGGESEC